MKHKKPFTEWFYRGYWPYWVGAVILGLLNILLTLVYKPIGITGDITKHGLHIWALMGGRPETLSTYFHEVGKEFSQPYSWLSEATVLNTGLVAGVLLASMVASEFRIKRVKSNRQLFIGITGGLLMGYGARLALGCNVGAMIGGIASQSLHGWVFGILSFLGAFAGVNIIKYINR